MERDITVEGATAIVKLKGKVTHQESQIFLDLGRVVKDGLRVLEMNLSDVDFIDSMGVGMLIILAEHSKAHGCLMRITGVTGQVERVFNATKLLEVIMWDKNLVKIERS